MILRPLVDSDIPDLLCIHRTPEVTLWWDEPDEEFPWDDPAATRLTIEVDGAVGGLIQFVEELDPKYRHASIDVSSIRRSTVAGSGRRQCGGLCVS